MLAPEPLKSPTVGSSQEIKIGPTLAVARLRPSHCPSKPSPGSTSSQRAVVDVVKWTKPLQVI